jgi:hypothetical protein
MSFDIQYQTGLLWQDSQHREWVYSHIMENDKKLATFILETEQPHLYRA